VSNSGVQAIRALLFLTGALIVIYAISDHPLYGGEPGFGTGQVVIAAMGVLLALCGMLPTSIAGGILLCAVSSLIMLAFAEVAGEFALGPRYRPIFQPDEKLIFKFIPNRHSVMTRTPVNGGETVTHRINSAGFRGDELRPAGEALRIAVYGDSFIHAIYALQEETFTAQLGSMLGKRLGMQVEAVNAGVSSYGPDQASLKMEAELPRLRPDLVIMTIFAGNDYGDLMRNKIFRLGADGSLAQNKWTLDADVRMWFELGQKESILKRAFRDRFARISRQSTKDAGTVNNVVNMDFLLKEAEREYRSFVVDRNDVVTNTHVDYYSAAVSLSPGSEVARYQVAMMQAVMRRIRDVAGKNGVPVTFLFIPHPFDVAGQYDDWKVDRALFPQYDGRNQMAPLESAARSLGVPFVSLYDVFLANDPNSLYFHGGDDHWNTAGQHLAAKVMTDYLLDRTLLLPRKAAAGTSKERN